MNPSKEELREYFTVLNEALDDIQHAAQLLDDHHDALHHAAVQLAAQLSSEIARISNQWGYCHE